MENIIKQYCTRGDLSTYDPYDIWKTKLGFLIKNLYNNHPNMGLLPSALLTLFDQFINNSYRIFYSVQEYSIVRAWAALILLKHYERSNQDWLLDFVRCHLDWLEDNTCKGYSGYCWGLGFDYAVDRALIYGRNMPLSTITPYPLEAFVRYTKITSDKRYLGVIHSIHNFFKYDIKILEETSSYIVTSYSAMRDRKVINSVSYTMYSFSALLPYIKKEDQQNTNVKIMKLYNYIAENQNADGSWFYSSEGKSFIDCFHSCIIIKNLIKANHIIDLHDCRSIIEKGYYYIKSNFFVEKLGLFKRFSVKNKPSLVNFDLYDNAEMLHLAFLMDDIALVKSLTKAIKISFCEGKDIYSQIDIFGRKRNKNMLRWAIMPYLYACSFKQMPTE